MPDRINKDETDPIKSILGPHGLDNRNKKGEQLLELLLSYDLKIANSFFTKESYTTWKQFNESRSQHMLDVFSISGSSWKRVRDCETIENGATSDHSAVSIKIHLNSIAANIKTNEMYAGKEDYAKIVAETEENEKFNKILEELAPGETPNYTHFFQSVMVAAKATATKLQKKPIDWFEFSKQTVQPAITKVNKLLNEHRKAIGPEADEIHAQLKLANKLRDIAVKAGKSAFLSHQAEEIGNISDGNTKAKWAAV